MKELGKYSLGMGDRFAKQGQAQLQAVIKAETELGVSITPVWNKSFREHKTVKSQPASVREEADNAVKALGWGKAYFVDADHITINTVGDFVDASDFFTIDVADYIGKAASADKVELFLQFCDRFIGEVKIPGVEKSFVIDEDALLKIAGKFLLAAEEAGKVYNYISEAKGEGNFVAEVSMDEVDQPQTPIELFFILAALKFS